MKHNYRVTYRRVGTTELQHIDVATLRSVSIIVDTLNSSSNYRDIEVSKLQRPRFHEVVLVFKP